jgi:hypothetical protein
MKDIVNIIMILYKKMLIYLSQIWNLIKEEHTQTNQHFFIKYHNYINYIFHFKENHYFYFFHLI